MTLCAFDNKSIFFTPPAELLESRPYYSTLQLPSLTFIFHGIAIILRKEKSSCARSSSQSLFQTAGMLHPKFLERGWTVYHTQVCL